MDNLPIILGVALVVVALVYFFFLRKRELPKSTDDISARAESKRPGKHGGHSESPRSVRKADRKPPAPESIQSSDVLSVDESQRARLVPVEPASATPPVVSKKDVADLRKGLAATRGGFMAKLKAIFVGKKDIDPAILEAVEEVMISSDVGVKTTHQILERLREGMNRKDFADGDAVWAALRAEATRILTLPAVQQTRDKPQVVLVVGVNGVGKTTSIGKLATKFSADGKKVVLAAGDTFRAAAVQQLEVWGKRVGAEVVRGKEGADPGAVAFEATKKAAELGADILLIDTAGRLHTKVNLMEEIKKVKRTITKAMDGAPHEILLVIDATTGQNALTQAVLFKEALDLTGIILTKLDGTARGGVVLAVCDELKVPVRYIGLGERAEDLREFVAADFVEALFGQDDGETEAA